MALPICHRTTGQLIQYYRELYKMSQEELASRVGCTALLVDEFERGIQRAGVQELHLFAYALNIKAWMLVKER